MYYYHLLKEKKYSSTQADGFLPLCTLYHKQKIVVSLFFFFLGGGLVLALRRYYRYSSSFSSVSSCALFWTTVCQYMFDVGQNYRV